MATAIAVDVSLNREGYPVEIFKNHRSVDEKFLCNICHKIIRDPVQSFCGHCFCKSCVHRISSSGVVERCQKCETEGSEEEFSILKMDQIFPDNAVRREMSKIPVTCIYDGCSWTGNFRDYEDHADVCMYRPVTCDACQQPVAQLVLDKHKKTLCPARPVECKFCALEFAAADQQQHDDSECPKKPVKCNSCGLTGRQENPLTREKLQQHLDNECPKAILVCPAGCDKQLLKSELEKHLKEKHRDWQAGLNLSLINLANMNIPQMINQIESLIAQTNNRITAVEQQVVNETLGARIRQTVEMHQTTYTQRVHAMEVKTNTFQSVVDSFGPDISRLITEIESHQRHRLTLKDEVDKLNSQRKSLERSLGLKETNIAEHELRFQALESTTYDGTFIFRITDFTKKLQDARTGSCISVYSAPFYTSCHGYKMCIRLYPNGDGMGKGSHLSLFFVVMRSHFDALLRWPFQQRVTFCLINQSGGEHMIDSFRPDPNSSSFRRPTSDMNIASGCPLFIRHEVLCNPENGYLKDETLFVRVVVDTSNIPDPLLTLNERIRR